METEGASLFVKVNTEGDAPVSGWGLFSAGVKVEEKADGSGLTMVLASEPVEDRMGDIVAPPWNLANFRRNPVILFGHNSWEPPVGRADKTKLASEQLTIGIKWDDSPLNHMGQLMAHQFRNGFMNAVSVGFRSLKVTHRSKLGEDHAHAGERGYLLQRNELLELSAVPIPALQTALAQRGADAPATFRQAVQWFTKGMRPDVEEVAESVIERAPTGPNADAVISAIAADADLCKRLALVLGVESVEKRIAHLVTAEDMRRHFEEMTNPVRGASLFV